MRPRPASPLLTIASICASVCKLPPFHRSSERRTSFYDGSISGGAGQYASAIGDRQGSPAFLASARATLVSNRGALLQDIRFGLRTALKHKGVTGVAIACLAIGIGLNTMIFSVTDGVLIHPLPFP